ncbi:MAG: T9SS type A sorting domain-containing protein [Bacteroidales bacterium]|nr:T9SS type A sorting domain-containing protein [Bacteroidales bacterium]
MKITLAVWAVLIFSNAAIGQVLVNFQEITQSYSLSFGQSVSSNSDYLLVGDSDFQVADDQTGIVYIYKKKPDNTWGELKSLTANEKSDHFGGKTLVTKDYAFVSTLSEDINYVYAYKRDGDTFNFFQKISPDSIMINSHFGFSLDLDTVTMTLAIGAPEWGQNGSVFIYNLSNNQWVQSYQIKESFDVSNSSFGFDLIINDGNLFIAAPYSLYQEEANGKVFAYQYINNKWTLKQTIVPIYTYVTNYFGYSIALADEELVIGAPGFDGLDNNSGKFYVFSQNDGVWSISQEFGNPSSAVNDYFGKEISASKNIIAVSSPYDYVPEINSFSGACYVYHKTNLWEKVDKIHPDYHHEQNSYFGKSLSVNDSTIVVGMPGKTYQKAFVFNFPIPVILTHPNEQITSSQSEVSFCITADRADNYKWQVSRDSGKTYCYIVDNITYQGVNTETLIVKTSNILNNFCFRCEAINQYGSSKSDDAFLSLEYDDQIAQLYPNPNTGVFYVKTFDDIQDYNYTIYDGMKHVVYETKSFNNLTEINIDYVQSGIYILAITKDKLKEYHKFIVR